jgi:hypothetical protein
MLSELAADGATATGPSASPGPDGSGPIPPPAVGRGFPEELALQGDVVPVRSGAVRGGVLQMGSVVAAGGRPVIPPPSGWGFWGLRGCKVGKIPRFLSSELITF